MKRQLNVLVDIFEDVDMVPRRGKLKSKRDMMIFQNAAEKGWKNRRIQDQWKRNFDFVKLQCYLDIRCNMKSERNTI